MKKWDKIGEVPNMVVNGVPVSTKIAYGPQVKGVYNPITNDAFADDHFFLLVNRDRDTGDLVYLKVDLETGAYGDPVVVSNSDIQSHPHPWYDPSQDVFTVSGGVLFGRSDLNANHPHFMVYAIDIEYGSVIWTEYREGYIISDPFLAIRAPLLDIDGSVIVGGPWGAHQASFWYAVRTVEYDLEGDPYWRISFIEENLNFHIAAGAPKTFNWLETTLHSSDLFKFPIPYMDSVESRGTNVFRGLWGDLTLGARRVLADLSYYDNGRYEKEVLCRVGFAPSGGKVQANCNENLPPRLELSPGITQRVYLDSSWDEEIIILDYSGQIAKGINSFTGSQRIVDYGSNIIPNIGTAWEDRIGYYSASTIYAAHAPSLNELIEEIIFDSRKLMKYNPVTLGVEVDMQAFSDPYTWIGGSNGPFDGMFVSSFGKIDIYSTDQSSPLSVVDERIIAFHYQTQKYIIFAARQHTSGWQIGRVGV